MDIMPAVRFPARADAFALFSTAGAVACRHPTQGAGVLELRIGPPCGRRAGAPFDWRVTVRDSRASGPSAHDVPARSRVSAVRPTFTAPRQTVHVEISCCGEGVSTRYSVSGEGSAPEPRPADGERAAEPAKRLPHARSVPPWSSGAAFRQDLAAVARSGTAPSRPPARTPSST